MSPRLPARRLALCLLAAAALSACSLAGDITPPPGARQLASEPTRPAVITPAATLTAGPSATAAASAPVNVAADSLPVNRPSAARGAALYAEHCAPCHGDTGNADGAMSANVPGGTEVIPKFAQPDLARAAAPQTWFNVVTQGRLEKFMPPFNEKLSDAQRWDVVAFLYALSTPPTQIDTGQAVYAAECAQCHGEAGQGDGPEAGAQTLRDFTDFALAAAVSPTELFDAITTGAGVAGHAFEANLSADERWAAVEYVRAFAYDYFAPGAPLPVQTGTISGRVLNGTAGASVTGPLSVDLLGFNPDTGVVETITGTTDAQGAYAFAGVPYQAGRQFVVAVTYNNITYHSDVVEFPSDHNQLELPVNVYETTEDTAGLRINRIHTFLLFEVPGQVTVGQLYIFSNLGDRTYQPADGRTVAFALPAGASGLTVQDGEDGVTFFRTEAGFEDSVPVLPGEATSQVLFSYQLPYDGELKFEQAVLYPVSEVNVLLGDLNVDLMGDGFIRAEATDASGTSFQNFSRLGLAANETLTFALQGQAAVAAATEQPGGVTLGDSTSLAIGLGTLAVVLLGLGVWWWRRTPRPARGRRQNREDLLQALAELDDDRAAGKVSEAEYAQERQWLKQELTKVWTDDGR